MTKTETAKVLSVINSTYPNWHSSNSEYTLSSWHYILADYDYSSISLALKAYIQTDVKGFAPSPGQLIDRITSIKDDTLPELLAWNMVYKAICNSGYNSEEEYAKLPPEVQKAVGSASVLEEWSKMDDATVQSVEQSHFLRAYRTELAKLKDISKLPDNLVNAIQSREVKKLDGR